jgi:hypothetical protein
VWEKTAEQDDCIISIDFLIQNYPVIDLKDYDLENFKSTKVLWFFDYNDLFDANGNKIPETVYR